MTTNRSDLLQIVLIRACLYERGACADFTLKSAALVKTNPTEWDAADDADDAALAQVARTAIG